MAKRNSGRKKRPKQTTSRHYPRTARLNALLTEIVADYFECVDEDELGFMTITGVEVDSDLNIADVFISILGDDGQRDEVVLETLEEHRKDVKRAIAQQAKLRKTPEVVFAFDPAVRAGAKIDAILASIPEPPKSESPGEAESLGETESPGEAELFTKTVNTDPDFTEDTANG